MKALFLSLSALLFLTCNQANHVNPYTEQLQGKVSLTADFDKHAKLLWKRDQIALFAHSKEGIESLQSIKQQTPLVMVSFSSDSKLAETLSSIPETIFYQIDPAQKRGAALVQVRSQGQLYLLSAMAHNSDGFACGNMELLLNLQGVSEPKIYPPIFETTVKLSSVAELTTEVKASNIESNIKELEQLGTRYHTTTTGLNTPVTIENLFKNAADGKISNISYEQIDHSATGVTNQKSLVVTIPGSSKKDEYVVIGAHLDSINRSNNSDAPGADDDASGISSLVEIVRVIAETGASFSRTIELHAYAAEEVGLVGSGDIAKTYKQEGRKVIAMMQFDMNTYSAEPNDKTIYLVENDTSIEIRRSMKNLINSYFDGDFVEARLSGGTSDHRSWYNQGFASVFPFENPAQYNPSLHTANDTTEVANNFELAARFVGLGLTYLGHYAGFDGAESEFASASRTDNLSDDIKVAIINTADESLWDMAIATISNAEKIETCTTDSIDATSCNAERTVLAFSKAENGRAFFINESGDAIELEDDEFRIFFAYDNNDALIALRTVQLSKK